MARLIPVFFLFLLVTSFCYSQQSRSYSLPDDVSYQDIEPNIVVVKLHQKQPGSNDRQAAPTLPSAIFAEIKTIKEAQKVFPEHQPPVPGINARKKEMEVDLSGIYRLHIEDRQDIIEVINALIKFNEVEYAEPYFKIKPFHEPNDPFANKESGNQDYLKVIKAYDAWSITRGDTSVVIGVLDTGYNPDHEDLKDNIKHNHADPINNFDDDEDGYKDNFAGWDFANNDNKPIADGNGHGTEVLGICSATNNNGLGIAGTGYNSKFMPLKVSRSEDNVFAFQYEAIVYAADKGCKVINLSWGAPNVFSNFVQDIINYAVLQKDAVIVAAAGNTHGQIDFYPASYNNVLSVGATDMNDNKASWATYSYFIDLMAPGQAIYTTKNDGTYGYVQGSSFSAPMVAGTAALVRSKFPHLNALQVKERLRVTADNIYHLPNNMPFQDQLGYGRLNMHRAVSSYSSPAIRMISFDYHNGFGKHAFFSDTVTITCQLINYLSPTSAAKAVLSTPSPFVTFINNTFDIGALTTLASTNNNTVPFKIALSANTPPGTHIPFRLTFEDGEYKDFQVFQMETSPDFVTIRNENIGLTVSGNGNLGFHNEEYSQGVGFTFNNSKILDYMGFMIGVSPTQVYDNVINRFDNKKRNKDFTSAVPIKFFNNGEAHNEARSSFEDNSSELPKLNIKIDQKVLLWNGLHENNLLIMEYRIYNAGVNSLNNIYTGIYADWNINNRHKNNIIWDDELKLSYSFDPSKPDLFAGIALISAQEAGAYAINNNSNANGDFSQDFIFSKQEKYAAMSSGTQYASLVENSPGKETSNVISALSPAISAGEWDKIAFAMVVGKSLDDLKANLESARKKYVAHTGNPPLVFSTQICEGQKAEIKPHGNSVYKFYADIELKNLLHTGTTYTTEPLEEDKSFYMVNTSKNYPGDIEQAKVLINRSVNDFSITPETLIIEEGKENTVQFNDFNTSSVNWKWTFGNGYGSTIKSPKATYSEGGVYDIKLIVENSTGCKNTIYKKLTVLVKSPDPEISGLKICQGETPSIKALNSSKIRVYLTPNSQYPIFEGEVFQPEGLTLNTSYYISNAEKDVESSRKLVSIEVFPHKAYFEVHPDSLNLNTKNSFFAINKSLNSSKIKWYFNDVLMSENSYVKFDYNQFSLLKIRLVSTSPEECFDEHIEEFEIRKSNTPLIDKVIACNGRAALIQPQNGKNFYFYEDASLIKLLHKGSSFSTVTYTRLFITGVDNFIESDPVEVAIDYQEFYPDFKMEPAILNLAQSQEVRFFDLSEGNISWAWDLGNGALQFIKNPVQAFSAPGEYSITLTASNQNGCKESVTKKLQVVHITNAEEVDASPALVLYPNPSKGSLFIDLQGHPHQKFDINIIDNTSRFLLKISVDYKGVPVELACNTLKPGIYHLQAKTIRGIFYKKLIIDN